MVFLWCDDDDADIDDDDNDNDKDVDYSNGICKFRWISALDFDYIRLWVLCTMSRLWMSVCVCV